MFPEVHLIVMCASFVWNALRSYAASPAGAAELATIEEMVSEIENPSQQSTTTAQSGASSSTAATGRRA